MGRSTKTTDFLKECMGDALIKLMKEKPLSKITAQEITDFAGVGRSTWFRNFSSKNETLTFYLIAHWKKWIKDHCDEDTPLTTDSAYEFFRFNYSIRDILDIIYRNEAQVCIYDAFYAIIMPRFEASLELRYMGKFYAHGLFGLLDEWVKRDYKENPDDMAALFKNELAKDFVISL